MSPYRTFGFVLLVVGVTLLVLGLRATDTVRESITEGITGQYTDKTTWHIVGGAAAAVAGAAMTLFGGRTSRAD